MLSAAPHQGKPARYPAPMPHSPGDTNRRAYDDPAVAAGYDAQNPDGPDHDFFRRLAEETGARRIVDLGCGTGLLTVTLAGSGRAVVGIDPAEAMLAVARARPGADAVRWLRGTAELIEPASADLAIMSGNVAMHLIGDDWHRALRRIAAGLVPGGRLAFETRNPALRAWEGWNAEPTETTTTAARLIESEVTSAPDRQSVVVHRWRQEDLDTGAVHEGEEHLQFRSAAQVRADLEVAGLTVERISGGWQRQEFDESRDALMVVEAVRV